MTTLVLEFIKGKNDDATKFTIFHSNSKVEITIIESCIDDIF